MWQVHGSELRRVTASPEVDDMLYYLARNQKEVLHRVNLEKKSVMKAIQIHNEVIMIKLHILDKELILSFP